ncbi:stage III sporulation protein AF [Paraliobacillus quinghaiensis]|uniref:Stage III sporulation protein AF n=1 Tax=Paraliobacillus quinghaiensis TaxID=470815 RepID=A0A917WXU9_9BACI|nr:stage III sporulation protein AF [Paraliobacillus quinghaiensis]GGM40240.1 stage III sporulation protein AF [Paraliobacillus quinghaiensis]
MSILINWITQIIIFLLIIMIVEMLLPQTTMKKYVHVVLSMLFLLLFLQPLFQLFQLDIEKEIQEAFAQFDAVENGNQLENQIELKKKEIQASQDAYVVEELVVQMKNQVKEELNQRYGVEITDIKFKFKEDRNPNMENLLKVNVYLSKSSDYRQGEIKDVVIGTKQKVEESSEFSNAELKRVTTYLNQMWELEEDLLSVVWEGVT